MSAKCSIIVKGNGEPLSTATVRVGPVTKKVSEKGIAVFDLADRTYYGVTISAPEYGKQIRKIYHGKGENSYIFNLRKKSEPKPEPEPEPKEIKPEVKTPIVSEYASNLGIDKERLVLLAIVVVAVLALGMMFIRRG